MLLLKYHEWTELLQSVLLAPQHDSIIDPPLLCVYQLHPGLLLSSNWFCHPGRVQTIKRPKRAWDHSKSVVGSTQSNHLQKKINKGLLESRLAVLSKNDSWELSRHCSKWINGFEDLCSQVLSILWNVTLGNIKISVLYSPTLTQIAKWELRNEHTRERVHERAKGEKG